MNAYNIWNILRNCNVYISFFFYGAHLDQHFFMSIIHLSE